MATRVKLKVFECTTETVDSTAYTPANNYTALLTGSKTF